MLSLTPHWPARTTLLPIRDRPRDADLAAEQAIVADDDVMADMHQVIELGAVADPCRRMVPLSMVELAPISTSSPMSTAPSEWMRIQLCALRRRPDRPGSRAPSSTPDASGVTKENPSPPIRAPGWAMKRAPIDTRAPMLTLFAQIAPAPSGRVHADKTLRPDHTLVRRSARAPDHAKRADADAAPRSRRRIDHGRGVDAGRDALPRVHHPGQPGHGKARARRRRSRPASPSACQSAPVPQHRCPRLPLASRSAYFGVHRQRQIIGPCSWPVRPRG